MLKSTIIRPSIFFKAKQGIKKPKSSYLVAKRPSYQPEIIVIWSESLGMRRKCHVKNPDRTGLSYMFATTINNKKPSRCFRRRLSSVDKSKMYISTSRKVP